MQLRVYFALSCSMRFQNPPHMLSADDLGDFSGISWETFLDFGCRRCLRSMLQKSYEPQKLWTLLFPHWSSLKLLPTGNRKLLRGFWKLCPLQSPSTSLQMCTAKCLRWRSPSTTWETCQNTGKMENGSQTNMLRGRYVSMLGPMSMRMRCGEGHLLKLESVRCVFPSPCLDFTSCVNQPK